MWAQVRTSVAPHADPHFCSTDSSKLCAEHPSPHLWQRATERCKRKQKFKPHTHVFNVFTCCNTTHTHTSAERTHQCVQETVTTPLGFPKDPGTAVTTPGAFGGSCGRAFGGFGIEPVGRCLGPAASVLKPRYACLLLSWYLCGVPEIREAKGNPVSNYLGFPY